MSIETPEELLMALSDCSYTYEACAVDWDLDRALNYIRAHDKTVVREGLHRAHDAIFRLMTGQTTMEYDAALAVALTVIQSLLKEYEVK